VPLHYFSIPVDDLDLSHAVEEGSFVQHVVEVEASHSIDFEGPVVFL
jgi:hypothetical protein